MFDTLILKITDKNAQLLEMLNVKSHHFQMQVPQFFDQFISVNVQHVYPQRFYVLKVLFPSSQEPWSSPAKPCPMHAILHVHFGWKCLTVLIPDSSDIIMKSIKSVKIWWIQWSLNFSFEFATKLSPCLHQRCGVNIHAHRPAGNCRRRWGRLEALNQSDWFPGFQKQLLPMFSQRKLEE